MSNNSDSGKLLGFKLSFYKEFNNGAPHTSIHVFCRSLEVRQCCLLDGFPCQITSIAESPRGKYGHYAISVHGVGLVDQRTHMEKFGPYFEVLVPAVVIDTRLDPDNDEFEFEHYDADGSPPISVSWMDEENIPQEEDHFVLTTNVMTSVDADQAIKTTVWAIPKRKACYKFFLQQREAHLLRERNKRAFQTFVGATKRKKNPIVVLGQVDLPVVRKTILDFVCGPQKYRWGDSNW